MGVNINPIPVTFIVPHQPEGNHTNPQPGLDFIGQRSGTIRYDCNLLGTHSDLLCLKGLVDFEMPLEVLIDKVRNAERELVCDYDPCPYPSFNLD
jgi:hypothetical protein